jgi:hypothetical protein
MAIGGGLSSLKRLEVALFFVTRCVSEEDLILPHPSLTRRVTIFQWLSRKRNFKTDASGFD